VSSAAAPPSPSELLTPCLLERRPLTLADSSEVYVEFEDVITVGDDALLAGSPSYRFKPVPGWAAERLSADVIAAAYLGQPGRAIDKPIAGTLGSVRAVALDARRWAAIMLQVDPDSLPAREEFRGLWYGEHDGERWTRVEAMEFPGARISSRMSSHLLRAGDRLVWAAWEAAPSGISTARVYERVNGAWTHALVPGEDRMEQVALGYHEESGLWLLLYGYDAGLPGFQKTLRLYRERAGVASGSNRWELASRVALAAPGVSLRRAGVAVQATGVSVSWTETGRGASRVMARVDITPDSPGTLVMLDELAYAARPAAMPDGSVIWVVDHLGVDLPTAELRVLRVANGEVVRVTSFPSPFLSSFTVRAAAPTEILAVGPEVNWSPIGVPVRSLILRLSTSC
jgi:hypothetical protein